MVSKIDIIVKKKYRGFCAKNPRGEIMRVFSIALLLLFLVACENPLLSQDERLEHLYRAIESGDGNKVKETVSKKIINKHLKNMDNPFIYAVSLGHEDIALKMLDYNPDLKETNIAGNTALHIAAENSMNDLAGKIISDSEIDINQVNDYGYTALHFSVEKQNEDLLELLLNNSADPNIANKEGYAPIHRAAANNNLQIIELLISQTNVNVQDVNGNTPLIYAVGQQSYDASQLLLENGADVNVANNQGVTPLANAVMFGDIRMVELLLANKADVNQKVNGQEIALLTDNIQIKELLTKGG